MARIKLITVICVILTTQCFGFRIQQNIRSLEDLGRKLGKHPFSEVPSSVFDRILYGRSIFVRTGCPYGTVRLGHDCIPPPSNPDYEYDG